MSIQLRSRLLSCILVAVGFTLIAPLLVHYSSIARAAGNIYVVNSTADTVDADVGADPACADAAGHCSLRAAIMQANFASGWDTITLPAGVYVLTRPGNTDDAAQLGDLDIVDDLTIQGAGSGVTIINGNGAVTTDRVFQVLASAKETTFSDLTIRGGKKISGTFDEGGGLYWEGGGGHLRLHDVIVDGNSAHYGGGIYLDYASDGGDVTLDNLILRANTATTAAGGGLVVALNGPVMDFTLRNSQVYSNTAFQGGGIYLQSTLIPFSIYSATIASSQIYSNTAGHGAGIDNDSGNADNPLLLIDSYLHHNHSASLAGAIENNGGLSVLRSTLDTNIAATQGGGIYNNDNGVLELTQSTLSANAAQFGGGLFIESFIYTRTLASVVNSTISGNTASHEGAGLYANGGRAQFYNATIAANQIVVPVGNFYPAMGAGLLITPNYGIPAIITLTNTLIGDNSLRVGIDAPVPDDCYGKVRAQGYNLIETLAHCAFENPSIGDVIGQDPRLGPLQLNGGSTATQALLPGSPAIDAGRPTGCANEFGQILNIDQRGWQRANGLHCDIGAVEVGLSLFTPLVLR